MGASNKKMSALDKQKWNRDDQLIKSARLWHNLLRACNESDDYNTSYYVGMFLAEQGIHLVDGIDPYVVLARYPGDIVAEMRESKQFSNRAIGVIDRMVKNITRG